MTNLELKNNIDLNITNKTQSSSITPVNVGSEMKNVVDYVDQEIANIELLEGPAGADGVDGVDGSTGSQGPIGPQGVPGPVGPAGLNWQGVWVSGTSYVVDDAVGYNGASWFCVNATSGTISPNLDSINWALLAAQGSTGPQGPQGIQGVQGDPGSSITKIVHTTISNASTLTLFSEPVVVLSNSNHPLVIKHPVSIYIKKTDTNPFTMDSQLLQVKDSVGNQVNSLSSQFMTTTTGFTQCMFIFNNNGISTNSMGDYKLNLQNSDPISGTSSLEVYLVYNEITL